MVLFDLAYAINFNMELSNKEQKEVLNKLLKKFDIDENIFLCVDTLDNKEIKIMMPKYYKLIQKHIKLTGNKDNKVIYPLYNPQYINYRYKYCRNNRYNEHNCYRYTLVREYLKTLK